MLGDLPNGIAMLPNDIIAILSDQALRRAFSTSAQWANFFHEFLSQAVLLSLKISLFTFFFICLGCFRN
jgi:hypothetical protein